MARSYRPTLAALLAALACFVLSASAQESYCSPMNTGSNSVYTWNWQSNGNCTNHCALEGTYAFAVIQKKDCYCSDYIPSTQVPINQCWESCPGFPAEHCGSSKDKLFIYLQATGQPKGTAGVGGQQQTTTADEPSKAPPSPIPPPPSKESSEPPPEPEPTTTLATVTESGVTIIKTIVQTPSSYPTSSTSPVIIDNGDSAPNVGAIAGGVAGGIIGLLAIIGLLVFFLWRRRKQQRQERDNDTPTGITRNTSTMSKAGLLGRTTEVGEKHFPSRTGTNTSRHTDPNAIATSPISTRRNSQPILVDSRLNPNAMVQLTYANGNVSRESLASVDDSRDYGRQLNVRNPDPYP